MIPKVPGCLPALTYPNKIFRRLTHLAICLRPKAPRKPIVFGVVGGYRGRVPLKLMRKGEGVIMRGEGYG